ncbi:MAG: 4Fe-4S dicluster domain-containing protein [Candidatus Tectomicrobia bacterium]|uniref:4Fe-4S dicluster domain-containing protein n=1 Tax=Tectimicrobiota bacterium TaxID=2528274 RepID=A0A932M0W7_UNCTE|nr:4Fe-4S dicluster domain-containing protein [Candidatus Tectomicrobia bacterium]
MKIRRRTFLGIAGLSALAVAEQKILGRVAGQGRNEASPRATGSQTARWAMVIDLRACLEKEGCTDCIAACHKVHNVPDFRNAAHEVKWTWKEPFERAFPGQKSRYAGQALQGGPVLVLCNHCDKPPCVRVCPTKATWKRADGIVMMDWHRCIGCRYCIAACPYGSRSFNWLDPRPQIRDLKADFPTRSKGVVEKCNFCEERLAAGKPPACVEACPERALVFGDLEDPASRVRELLRSRYAIRRKPELGTEPEIYYLV